MVVSSSRWPDRVVLQDRPTPLEPLDRLSRHLGRGDGELFVKRDDLTQVAGGGGKVRKLEFVAARAVLEGADTLVTLGAVQSNAARTTATVARRLGLHACLILVGEPPATDTGNVLLDRLFGAEIRWCAADDPRSEREVLADEADRLRRIGYRPHVIPSGVSSAIGALGYVRAANELLDQLPDTDVVVTASGTGATQAGLVVGIGDHSRVLGVRIGNRPQLRERVATLGEECAQLLGKDPPVGTPRLDEDHVGGGYRDPTMSGFEAISLLARLEGLVLDPVYTGKAMAAMLTHLREQRIHPGARVVFLHSGGVPGLFAADESEWVAERLGSVDRHH